MRRRTRPSRNLTDFRSPLLRPVSCEIYVEAGPDGSPVILNSVEIEGQSGVRILSQSEVDETEVLLIYRRWRRDPQNRTRIRWVCLEDLKEKFKFNGYDTDNRQGEAPQDDSGREY